jgi:hypothetical protein
VKADLRAVPDRLTANGAAASSIAAEVSAAEVMALWWPAELGVLPSASWFDDGPLLSQPSLATIRFRLACGTMRWANVLGGCLFRRMWSFSNGS